MRPIAFLLLLLFLTTPAHAQFDDFGASYGEGETVIVRADISIPGTDPYTATVRLLGLRCAECGTPEPAIWLGLAADGRVAIERAGIARDDVIPTHPATFDRSRIVTVTWLVELSVDPARVVVWFDGVVVFDNELIETLPDLFAGIDSGAEFQDGAMSYNTVDGPPVVSSGPQPQASGIVVVRP